MFLTCYGAGPDVFFPDALAVFRRKKEICARRSIRLRTPLDKEIDLGAPDAATRIYRANRAMMSECDICIANLSPFRGPSADDGTAFEVGFFDAMRRPVFAYSNAAEPLDARTRAFQSDHPDPFSIEEFGLPANLMMPCAVLDRGGLPMFTAPQGPLAYNDLAVFERLVEAVAERCAPVARLRQAVSRHCPDEAVAAEALRRPLAALAGATPLEAVIADPGAAEALAALIRR